MKGPVAAARVGIRKSVLFFLLYCVKENVFHCPFLQHLAFLAASALLMSVAVMPTGVGE